MHPSNEKEWIRRYRNNLNALKERYPELYEEMVTPKKRPLTKPVKLHGGDPYPDLLIDNPTQKLLYYGTPNPMAYCEKYLASLDLGYAPLIIFMGFGLGYQVMSALDQYAKDLNIQHILIIEKDTEIFRMAMTLHDFSPVIRHPDIEFIIGKPPEDLFSHLLIYLHGKSELFHFFKSLKIVILPSMQLSEADYYQSAVQSLKSSITHLQQHYGNDPYDSLLGIEQSLKNIVPMIEDPGIHAFKDIFQGKPAVIVGAGPSLNRSMDLLKEASHRALLISVDAALKPLLKQGIKPHMVTNIERSGGQEAFFNGVGNLEDIFFVFSPVATHETYRAYQGPKIIAHRYQEVVQWLGIDTGSLSGGPLVGNFAFSIAEYLGCDPIILVGMELSFPSSGATHVEGMVFGVQENYRKNMIEVEGNHGEILLTNRYFEDSRKSLEMQIEKFGGLCINATQGGARIRGSILMDLKNALCGYCPHLLDVKNDLYKVWEKERRNRPDLEEEMSRVSSVLDWTISELQSSLDACRKGIEIIDGIERDYTLLSGTEPNPDALRKVKEIENELFQLRGQFISQPGLKFLSYIFSGYHNDYAMRRSSLFDQYHDRDLARLKAFLNDMDYFKTMGQLIVSTIYAIERAKTDLEKERCHSSSSSITDYLMKNLIPTHKRSSKDPSCFDPWEMDGEPS